MILVCRFVFLDMKCNPLHNLQLSFLRCIALLAFVFVSCSDSESLPASSEEESSPINFESPEWEVQLGSSNQLPFFPEKYANYFTYSFTRPVGDSTIIKLEGVFPNTRYASLVVYDNTSRDPIAILGDINIRPSANSNNPFVQGNYIPAQSYVIYIAPQSINTSGFDNVLTYDDTLTSLSIFLRYYLPEEDAFGGVDLPKISAVNVDDLLVAAPESNNIESLVSFDSVILQLELLSKTLFFNEPKADRFFFRANGDNSGNFANPDNQYLINATTLSNDEVILLRWKAPVVAETFSGLETADMRYLSMSLSDLNSFNYETFSDRELYIAQDGYINLVIARDDTEVAKQAKGLNFLIWPENLGSQGYLLYRNLLTHTNFKNSIANCPTISGNYVDFLNNPENYNAQHCMGEFAPFGKKMNKSSFLEDFGGIEVSY